ncbi:MAG: NAD+ synthase [Candidatus Methanomethyliales bacterium]|nr:NAD+ synthase [Candidatus Methanomethylicales archaeon]
MRVEALKQLDARGAENCIIEFLRERIRDRGAVFGLSGGLDSSTIAGLLVKALGRDKVLALIMPEATSTPLVDLQDAMKVAEIFGLKYKTIDITEIVESFLKQVGRFGEMVAEGNLKARIRMAILYYFANLEKRIVVGSGDRSELAIGYFTKYGDGGVDILPIGGLYKTQVKVLARHLGIPEEIVEKVSSPRLWPGHSIKEELGMDYDEIDAVLYYHLDLGYGLSKIVELFGEEKRQKVERVLGRVVENAHKLTTPPIARIPPDILFGRGATQRSP